MVQLCCHCVALYYNNLFGYSFARDNDVSEKIPLYMETILCGCEKTINPHRANGETKLMMPMQGACTRYRKCSWARTFSQLLLPDIDNGNLPRARLVPVWCKIVNYGIFSDCEKTTVVGSFRRHCLARNCFGIKLLNQQMRHNFSGVKYDILFCVRAA